jgi:hypothetical protein
MYSSWCQPVTGLCIFGQVLARCKGATVIKEREGSNSIVVIAIQAVVGVNFRTYVRKGRDIHIRKGRLQRIGDWGRGTC